MAASSKDACQRNDDLDKGRWDGLSLMTCAMQVGVNFNGLCAVSGGEDSLIKIWC